MSEIFELMHHASNVAQTAKDAMGQSLAADNTTVEIARKIIEEAKRLLPQNAILKMVNLPTSGDLPWTSIRSAMDAVANALSEENTSRASQTTTIRRTSQWG